MTIREYSGENYLWTQQLATDPTNRESNDAQWAAMRAEITAVLTARGIKPQSWDFRNGNYKHGGVNLTVTYYLHHHAAKTVTA